MYTVAWEIETLQIFSAMNSNSVHRCGALSLSLSLKCQLFAIDCLPPCFLLYTVATNTVNSFKLLHYHKLACAWPCLVVFQIVSITFCGNFLCTLAIRGKKFKHGILNTWILLLVKYFQNMIGCRENGRGKMTTGHVSCWWVIMYSDKFELFMNMYEEGKEERESQRERERKGGRGGKEEDR